MIKFTIGVFGLLIGTFLGVYFMWFDYLASDWMAFALDLLIFGLVMDASYRLMKRS